MLKNRVCACLLVALLLAAMLPVSVAAAGALPSGTPAYEQNTFVGVSPLGTTINLFDYWLTGQTDPDDEVSDGFENQGINNGHALLFGKGMDHEQYGHGLWNTWTGSKDPSPRTGIVADELGYDGYPVLNQGVQGTDYMQDREGGESLAYLFDPDRTHDGKAVYKDVQGLLSINEDDYYAYDSTKNYAVYYQTSSHGDSNNFRLYDRPGVLAGGSSPDGQFFPFNAVQTESHGSFEGKEYYNSNLRSDNAPINHYFGLHMSTRFVQQHGGYTTEEQKKEVTYTFSGDDDVWVFIDGTLVADLGGIHDMASLSINFATGVITINGESQKQTLGQILEYHGNNTLPDDTYHTLDFFYLERGNVDSNMSLKYNLVYVPESSIYKIDQDGNPLPGRNFELYEAVLQNGKYVAGEEVLAKGTTDADGRIILLDENNDLLTIQELITELNNPDLTNETTALILRETDSPDDGYRSSGDLELYFYQSQTDSPPFLLSRNHWQTGAHAVARLAATTNASIVHTQGTANFEPDKNLMFAVVFKKVGNDEWRPISGSPATGWTIAADDSWESIQKANLYRFMLSSSGSYTAMIDELPGDIKKYEEAGGGEDSYRIRYYFSKQNVLEAIDGDNTYEITSPMNRVAAVNLYVPNIRNDLTVQKLDQNGNLITGGRATFELRPASDGTYNPSATAAQTRTEITSEGVATFTAIPNGTYYLVETAAPKGYTENATQVKVIVNDTGVYANAGTAEDGISVERGVGRLVNSMAQFASKDTVDTTLNQIVAKFYTTETEPNEDFQWRKIEVTGDGGAAFSPVEGVDYHPAYSVTENSPQDAEWYLFGTAPGSVATTPVGMHLAHLADHSGGRCDGLYQTTVKLKDGGQGITAQETDTGWSALLVEQCMFHTRDNGTPHTDLTGAYLTDLTALFTGDVTVKVKNDPIVGKLAVQKTVAGNAGETDREWEFTIELKNAGAPLSGNFYYEVGSIVTGVDQPKDGTLTFNSDGKATISLKHGQKITIEGIPANVIYTVTEEKDDGYVTTSVDDKGTIQDNNTATAAFTNTRDVFQSLTVKKTVGGADGDKEKLWRFTIELKKAGTPLNGTFQCKGGSFDGVIPPEVGTLEFVDGKADIYLKHGQTIAIENLPVNVDYIVTEDEAGEKGYETEPQSGIITGTVQADAGSTAAFLNARTIPRGGLTVTKTVEGDAGDTGREWHFTVTIEDAGIHGTYGDMRFTNGVAMFTLKHDQSVTATGLPAGLSYTVTEKEAGQEGYVTKAAGDRGRIPAEGTAMATFTNMKNVPRGNLTVSKTVSGSNPPSKTAFGFTVILSDRTVDGRFGEMTFRSGVAEFTLRHGETVTASGLPAGVGYLVEEDADEAYTTSSQGAEGTVPQDDTALARFVNRRIVLPPKTGDDSHTELWFMLMAFSLCCAAFLIGHQKRGGRTGR